MKQITTLFLLLLSVFSFSQNIKTIYYDAEWKVINNKKNATYYRNIEPYSKDKTHFLVKDFYITGEKQMEAILSSIEPEINDGYSNFYYKNGQQNTARNYINGKENGVYKEWYSNGQLKMEGNIKDDNKTGSWSYFYSNGKLNTSGIYLNNNKNGIWKIYNIHGINYLNKIYLDGLLNKIEILDNKKIVYEYYSELNEKDNKENLIPFIDYNTENEYELFATAIIDNINFLENNIKLDQFDEVYAYTMLWLTNNPTLGKFGLNMTKFVADFPLKIEKTYEFESLMFKMYTLGLGKYSINRSTNRKDEIAAQVSGIETMLKLYNALKAKNTKAISKKMEKLSDLSIKNQLYDFIKNY